MRAIAVVSRLMVSHNGFFFDDNNVEGRISFLKLKRRSEANSTASNDHYIVLHGPNFCPKLSIN